MQVNTLENGCAVCAGQGTHLSNR